MMLDFDAAAPPPAPAVEEVRALAAGRAPVSVVLSPGRDIAAALAAHPEGTTFLLKAGVHRAGELHPKAGQTILGEDGAVLNGSRVLDRWTAGHGVWRHDGLPEPMFHSGRSADGTPTALLREDLFVGGRLYRRVADGADLGPGTWYFEGGTAWLADDPTGKLVEYGGYDYAIGGEAPNVTLRNLVVEKYATRAQVGAVNGSGSVGWRVIDVTARWNHGRGLSLGTGMRVEGGSYSDNGQLGIGGIGNGAVIDGVEIARNNYAGFSDVWEAGGIKFSRSDGLVLRNARIHGNFGSGVWGDIDCIRVTIEDNVILRNAHIGIQYEISVEATIRGNLVGFSAEDGYTNAWWGSNILIQNSSRSHVHGNVVLVDKGDGINVSQQRRKTGAHGPRLALDNRVYGNIVVHTNAPGTNGLHGDHLTDRLYAANLFHANRYVVPDRTARYWNHRGGRTRDELAALGWEDGSTVTEVRGAEAEERPTLDVHLDTPAAEVLEGSARGDVFVMRAGHRGDRIRQLDPERDLVVVQGAEPVSVTRDGEDLAVATAEGGGFRIEGLGALDPARLRIMTP